MFHLILSCCCFVLFVGGNGINLSSATEAVATESWHGRIVGGATALSGQFPYTVSLRTTTLQSHFCGAFIITNRWLGSAGHCTNTRLPTSFIAVVGSVSKTLDGKNMAILKFVNHPAFNSSNLRNDISLIKTVNAIEFSPTVQPIRLSSAPAAIGTVATISGWGYTTNPGQAASNLQWIRVKTINNDDCRKKMTKSNAARIFDTSICAEAQDNGGACMGDSGGPMVRTSGILVGIVSWGVPCSMHFPDVYTRIDSYHSWIDSVLDF